MKFLDLEAQYVSIKNEIDRAIHTVIIRGDFIMGKEVYELEEKIADYCGVKFGVALNSGTDALLAAVKGLGIGPGDEVIVPDFTYIATAEVICAVGAKPVFVDIDPITFNIDPTLIEAAITKKTKAIIPVHLYGLMADMDPIRAVAKKHGLLVIEDAAQAIGAEYKGKRAGSIGDAGCLSFFPTKNLGAYGDGGMLVTNNKQLADWARKWRIHGQSKKYYTDFVGVSSRLDTIQAAILLVKLKHLNKWTTERIRIACIYSKILERSKIITPHTPLKYKHVFHQYTIKVINRDKLIKIFKKVNIPYSIYYPIPLHSQHSFAKYTHSSNKLPISEKICKQVLSLPIFPELRPDEQKTIAKLLQ